MTAKGMKVAARRERSFMMAVECGGLRVSFSCFNGLLATLTLFAEERMPTRTSMLHLFI